jgi:predicted dehydrogenase
VVAVADSNAGARAEATLLLDDGAAVEVDFRKLDPRTFDAVVVATPNFTHLAVLQHIVQWRKHLLVEKPLCTTVADCYAVQALLEAQSIQDETAAEAHATAAAAGEAGAGSGPAPPPQPTAAPLFWVGMEYRYMPPVAKLLSIVDSGKLGPLRMVSIREHRFPFLLKVDDWNRFSHFTGGTLVEKCCHFWDLMRRIVGPGSVATKVFASGGMDVNHLDERYDATRAQRAQSVGAGGGGGGGNRSALASPSSNSSGGGSPSPRRAEAQPDIVDNAFVIVEFEGGVRCCLDLCMFAEDRQHEEVCVVGGLGKVHAEAPQCVVTHHTPTQRASGSDPRNSRTPPPLGTYEANVEVRARGGGGCVFRFRGLTRCVCEWGGELSQLGPRSHFFIC